MQRQLRTLQVGMGWFPEETGGLSRFYYNLLENLPAVNVESFGLVTGSQRVQSMTGGRVRAFSPTSAPLPMRLWRLRAMARSAINRNQFDLICSHFALYSFPVNGLSSSIPRVVHFQGPWALESKIEGQSHALVWIKKAFERSVFKHVQRFITLSEAFRDILHRLYGVPLDKIVVGPGGVDADAFDPQCTRREAREHLSWPVDRAIVVVVRRLAQRMGLENLVHSMESVKRRVPDALLLIAGKGPLAGDLERQIKDLDLNEHVRLLGFVADEDLPYVYRAADLSVVPTTALEGFGLIMVESLAAGTPVLVTPVGALPEVMRGLAPQLILPDAGIHSLADGIISALRGEISLPNDAACMAYARDHYDWSVVARFEREIYLDVLR